MRIKNFLRLHLLNNFACKKFRRFFCFTEYSWRSGKHLRHLPSLCPPFANRSFLGNFDRLNHPRTSGLPALPHPIYKSSFTFSKTSTSAGSHFTLSSFSAESQAAFSCSKSVSLPETTEHKKHSIVR